MVVRPEDTLFDVPCAKDCDDVLLSY
jgi:hypothetical protein